MIRLFTLLSVLILLSCSLNNSTDSGLRECYGKCIQSSDGSKYKMKLEVVSDSAENSTFFSMVQNLNKVNDSEFIITFDDFSSKSLIYNIQKSFMDSVEFHCQIESDGYDLKNKKFIWDLFLNSQIPEYRSMLLDELGDKKDSILNRIEPMGQFIQFITPLVQIQNLEIPSEQEQIKWKGFVHGEYYFINNYLIPCEFVLIRESDESWELKTSIDVLKLKTELKELGLDNKLDGITKESVVKSISKISGNDIQEFIWNRPHLFPESNEIRLTYVRM